MPLLDEHYAEALTIHYRPYGLMRPPLGAVPEHSLFVRLESLNLLTVPLGEHLRRLEDPEGATTVEANSKEAEALKRFEFNLVPAGDKLKLDPYQKSAEELWKCFQEWQDTVHSQQQVGHQAQGRGQVRARAQAPAQLQTPREGRGRGRV